MTTTVIEIDDGEFVVELSTGGVAGSTDFLGLTDTPDTYAASALKLVRVNAGATALEFASGGTATLADADYGDIVVSGGGTVFTYDGTVPVLHGGTGQTTEAEALGEMIQALVVDASPDSANDYVATYDASADTGKKVLISSLTGSGLTSPVGVADGGTGQTTAAEAVGELIQALTEDTNPDFQSDFIGTYDGSADTGKKVALSTITRDFLTAERNYYVRTVPVDVTISNGSPAVVTWNSHGLSNDDPIVFHKPRDSQSCTITIATPGVVTATAHGFAANDPILFRTTNALPTGITQGTTYFVIAAGLATDSFRFSASSGGAAVNTSGTQSGTHYVERVATLPTMVPIFIAGGYDPDPEFTPPTDITYIQVKQGVVYYATNVSTNTFNFSLSPGGVNIVNTTSATTGKIQCQTGNDDNDGADTTKAHALLHIQEAFARWQELDPREFQTFVNVSPGHYHSVSIQRNPPLGTGSQARSVFNPISINGSGDYAQTTLPGKTETIIHANHALGNIGAQYAINIGGTQARTRINDLTMAADFALVPADANIPASGAYAIGVGDNGETRLFRCSADSSGLVAPAEGGECVAAGTYGEIDLNQTFKVIGSDWAVFMTATHWSEASSVTDIILIGQPHFTDCFYGSRYYSRVALSVEPTGTCTGRKFSLVRFAHLSVTGAIPGSTAGLAQTGTAINSDGILRTLHLSDGDGIYDDVDNEQLLFGKTASAVNYAKLSNSATGAGPTLAALGDDTNIDLVLAGKGAGKVRGANESIIIAASDETTALTTGTAKVTFRMPYAFTVTAVRASLTTAQTSGSIFTVDINESGTTVISTKLTIDNTEKTSTTAATAAVISDSALADDAEITVDIDQIGDGTAKGLKVYLIGHQ